MKGTIMLDKDGFSIPTDIALSLLVKLYPLFKPDDSRPFYLKLEQCEIQLHS